MTRPLFLSFSFFLSFYTLHRNDLNKIFNDDNNNITKNNVMRVGSLDHMPARICGASVSVARRLAMDVFCIQQCELSIVNARHTFSRGLRSCSASKLSKPLYRNIFTSTFSVCAKPWFPSSNHHSLSFTSPAIKTKKKTQKVLISDSRINAVGLAFITVTSAR